MYVSGSMRQPQFDALIADRGYPKLADYLNAKYPDKVVAAVGQKNYAMYTMGGPAADIRVTFGGRNFDCDGDADQPTTPGVDPSGVNVPDLHHRARSCSRFYVDADTRTSTTAPRRRRRPGCTRCRATATSGGNRPRPPGGDIWVDRCGVRRSWTTRTGAECS